MATVHAVLAWADCVSISFLRGFTRTTMQGCGANSSTLLSYTYKCTREESGRNLKWKRFTL